MKYKYEYVPTHLVRDILTSSKFKVQMKELSIKPMVMFRGFQREVDHGSTWLKERGLGKVSQSNMQKTNTSWLIRAIWYSWVASFGMFDA